MSDGKKVERIVKRHLDRNLKFVPNDIMIEIQIYIMIICFALLFEIFITFTC